MTQTSKKLQLVVDTNVILASVSRKSVNNWIFQKILDEEIDIFISNEILLEYKEKLSTNFSETLAKNVIEIFLIADNVYKIIPYFHWNLINVNKSDNKFVDCAVASNADYILTNDKHFKILKSIKFPRINVINIDEFKKMFKQ